MFEHNKKYGKNCPYCGSKLKRKSDYCEKCGKPIDFYIHTRNYKRLLRLLSIILVPFIIVFIVWSIIDFSIIVFTALIFPSFFAAIILLVEFSFKKVKIYITYNYFRVLIGNDLFFQINWKEIKEVNIIEELYELYLSGSRFTPSRIKIDTGHKLEFIDSIKKESIRFWCFRLSHQKENKIINKLEYFSTVRGKKVNRIKSSGAAIRLSKAKKKCAKIKSLVERGR